MTEPKKIMTWGSPAAETKSDGIAAATKVNTVPLPEEVDFNWDLVDFLSSQEFVPAPAPSPISPSLSRADDFRKRQKEELEKFLQQQKEAEEAFLLEQQQREEEEEETRRKRQEEEEAVEKKPCPRVKENTESQTVMIILNNLAELRSLKEIYQTSLLQPKRKRPSRAKQPNPVTTPEIPPLVISTQSLTRASPQVGLGRGKGLSIPKKLCPLDLLKEKRGSGDVCQDSEGSGDENIDNGSFSTESEVKVLTVKKKSAKCTFQTSGKVDINDLRVNMETLKINTQASSGTEVEYFVAKNGTVDNTAPMSDCEAIEDLREKKVSLEVDQTYSSKNAETLTVKDETVKLIGCSTNSTTSEILTGKEENVKLIVKADDKTEDYILGLDEEYVKITKDASFKEEFESCRAGSRVSEREEEVESYNNIVPSDGLVIGQDFSDCEMVDDLNLPCLQEAYRSDENQENDLFCYHDIHKGRYEHDEFDEIFESMKKKQSYGAKERKHGWSEEVEVIVPCFYEDKQCLKSYPLFSVQQEFTPVTSTDEYVLMGKEEHFEASSMNCKEINKMNSDKSVITTVDRSDFISLESEKKKALSSELHFRNIENPLSFVSQKINRERMEGLIHLNEGVKLMSCRGQLVSSSLRVSFETDDTCLNQVKDSNENKQQILSNVGVVVQKEKYVVEKDERTTRDIDLKEKKKHHLRQIVWLPRNWLPLPRLGRDEIVGFVEEQTRDGHGRSTLSPSEHEELKEMLRQLASDNLPGPKITMKYEMLRLCTMKTFPGQDRPFAVRIVGAGFYYAGHKDQVICYCCGSRKEGWVLGDIPLLIHQNMAPGCGFLSNNAVVNVPVRKANCTKSPSPADVRLLAIQRADGSNQSVTVQGESSLMYLSSEQNRVSILNMPHQMLVTNKSSTSDLLMASGRQKVSDSLQSVSAHADSMKEPQPKYPQYAVKNMRINSFQGWPAELRQKPEEMAECGFYYAGFNDCVRCFHCGVGLRHWMSEDDPWIEHARWSTECIYVLKMKGEEFVSLVKMAVEIAEREEAARSNGGGNLALQNSNEATPTAIIKEASKDLTGSVGATDGNAVKMAASTLPPGNSEIQKYLLTDAAQSVLDMGYQPKLVLRAIERVLMKKGSEELTGEIIMEAVFEIDEEDKSQGKTKPVFVQSTEGDKSGNKAIISSESSNKQDGQQGHEATGNTQLEESQIDPEKNHERTQRIT